MTKQILFTGIVGILGAVLMFVGDMFLYFTIAHINDFEKEIVGILANVSINRLIIGGLIGPLAGLMYIIGFYQIVLAIKEEYKKIAVAIFILLSIGMMYGSAFHSHFTHLGIMSNFNHLEALKEAESYSMATFAMMFFPTFLAYIVLAYLILSNKTLYPKWIIFFSPIVLFWLAPLMQELPQPFLIVIGGGWSNIVFIIFFTVSTMTLLKSTKV